MNKIAYLIVAMMLSGCVTRTWPNGAPGYSKTHWVQGQGAVELAPASKAICGISGIAGRFAGAGEWVMVGIDSNQNWIITGASKQNGVSVDVTCVSPSAFKFTDGASWSNGIWTQAFKSKNNICWGEPSEVDPGDPDEPGFGNVEGEAYDCPVDSSAIPLLGGDACYLAAFGGYRLRDGELIDVEQWYKSGDPTWYLKNTAFDIGKYTWAGAACISFVNDKAFGGPAVYNTNLTFWSYGGAGPVTVPKSLPNKNDAFCVIQRIGGQFSAAEDSVAVRDSDLSGGQTLVGTSSKATVSATARAPQSRIARIGYTEGNHGARGVEPRQVDGGGGVDVGSD